MVSTLDAAERLNLHEIRTKNKGESRAAKANITDSPAAEELKQ
jgi:hypothetical protein